MTAPEWSVAVHPHREGQVDITGAKSSPYVKIFYSE